MIQSKVGDSTTVAAWLDSLSKSQRDAFTYYAKNSTSDIEAFLFARFLKPGYEGSISDLTAFIQERYPKADLRKDLLIEIDAPNSLSSLTRAAVLSTMTIQSLICFAFAHRKPLAF